MYLCFLKIKEQEPKKTKLKFVDKENKSLVVMGNYDGDNK